jgi:hypothetical protein
VQQKRHANLYLCNQALVSVVGRNGATEEDEDSPYIVSMPSEDANPIAKKLLNTPIGHNTADS